SRVQVPRAGGGGQRPSAERQRDLGAGGHLVLDQRGGALDRALQRGPAQTAVVEQYADLAAPLVLSIDGDELAGAGGGPPMDGAHILAGAVVAQGVQLDA